MLKEINEIDHITFYGNNLKELSIKTKKSLFNSIKLLQYDWPYLRLSVNFPVIPDLPNLR